MEVELKGIHYEISDNTREYIDKKLHKLDHVKDKIITLTITIYKKKKNEYGVEGNAHFRWNKDAHIETDEFDLYKAIDMLFDKLQVKATREKEKKQEHK